MPKVNRCQFDGYVVGASYPIPEDPGEFFVPGAVWVVGCNQLRCASCGVRVRNQEGFFPREEPGGHQAEIYRTQDWSTLGYLDHGPNWAGHRMYACQCTTHTEGSARPLHDETEDRTVAPWHCGGHPLAVEGARYYGVEVKLEMDWEGLVSKAFADWSPPEIRPETEVPSQALWVRALYRRLTGTPMAESLARAAAACLTHEEPHEGAMVRARALRFFYGQPNAPGAERLAILAAGDRALFRGFPNPFPSAEPDLEAWLLAALGQRLSIGFAPDFDELRSLARREALRPGRAMGVLRGLARADWRWLMDHAVSIVEGTPGAAAELLVELDQAGNDEDIGVIGAMVARVPGIDVKEFRRQAKIFFEGRVRRKILSGLPAQ